MRWRRGVTGDRSLLVAVQTPQAFSIEALRRGHADGRDATDDSSLMDLIGIAIRHVPGERSNLKITLPEDLVVARALLRERTQQALSQHGQEENQEVDQRS